MIKDKEVLSGLISHGYALNVGQTPWYMARQVYKGSPDREVVRLITPKEVRAPKKEYFGESNIITLGGVFEQVGGQEDFVGGGIQKVGEG